MDFERLHVLKVNAQYRGQIVHAHPLGFEHFDPAALPVPTIGEVPYGHANDFLAWEGIEQVMEVYFDTHGMSTKSLTGVGGGKDVLWGCTYTDSRISEHSIIDGHLIRGKPNNAPGRSPYGVGGK